MAPSDRTVALGVDVAERQSRPPGRRSTRCRSRPDRSTSFKDIFDTLARQIETRAAGQAARGAPLARVSVRRRPPPDRRRARASARPRSPRRSPARSAARGAASSSPPTSCRPTSPACRSGTARATTSSSGRAACSRTSCSPTRSTARRRRRSRRCSRRWRNGRSRSTRHTYRLPTPFMVIATQNPVELEGTYPLPEAQLDRFLLRLRIGYPDRDAELAILDAHGEGEIERRRARAGDRRGDGRGVVAGARRRSTSRPSSRATSSTSSRRPVITATSCSV